ncbi:AhpC/TSA family protein [Sphingobacterium phlebotomi]|uniref:AhpC/TSA family protein n=1 Tax=Sphingobacterium phlebotomi TaxID=2605433 RepID=A0A5D4GSP2_9SPHI|nr:TlpA disulfide reductase family protein [Sphingobacterium phlebotomi]TYR31786.1 AhpC/TSA family protein [Sphingobacterium phlebotomi]
MYKTLLFLGLSLCLPFIGEAQEGFTISGKISGLDDAAIVYLALVQDGKYENVDSTEAKSGNFQLRGKVSEPQNAVLYLRRLSGTEKKRDQLSFFIENTAININGVDSLVHAEVSGSVSDQQMRQLDAEIRPLTKQITQLQDEYANRPKEELFVDGEPTEELVKARETMQRLVGEIKTINRNFVEDNVDSYYALNVYYFNVLGNKFDPEEIEPLFLRFPEHLRNSELGKKTWDKIQTGKRMTTGSVAVDFTQNDLNDQPFTLSSLRGKYVLVDFWASWCVPCRQENPNLVKAYEALKDKNFEIVGVSLDQNKSAWENAVKTDNLPWIHVSDLQGWKNEVSTLYGIASVPQNFLINPEGIIIGTNVRGEKLTETLTTLIDKK